MACRKRACRDTFDVEALIASNNPVIRVLQKAADNVGDVYSVDWTRALATRHLHACDDIQTPYGPLTGELQVDVSEGGGGDPSNLVPTTCINPFALLWWLGSISSHFGAFLASHLPPITKLIFYSDNVTPGNVKRHDKGRQFCAIYFTFSHFPSWFLSRRSLSWFKFAYVPCTSIGHALSMTRLWRTVMYKFFSPEGSWDFETTGVRVPHGDGCFHLRAEYGTTIEDIDAWRATCGFKGPSGWKPCFRCTNLVGRVGPYSEFEDDWLVHVASPEHQRIEQHTVQSFERMIREFEDAVANGATKGQIKELQILHGVNYCADGLLFDPFLRQRMRFPNAVSFDSMHILFCILRSRAIPRKCNPQGVGD